MQHGRELEVLASRHLQVVVAHSTFIEINAAWTPFDPSMFVEVFQSRAT
jgi:histidinol phosphatase-like PHP family hydrolase